MKKAFSFPRAAWTALFLTLLCACSPTDTKDGGETLVFQPLPERFQAGRADLPMTHIQVVGSHNSYKLFIPPADLFLIGLSDSSAADSLDYGHVPLADQLDLGMRQLELDIFYDPEGGRYASPLLPRLTGFGFAGKDFDRAALAEPGFKVLHVQDIDARSRCTTLIDCLTTIRTWSDDHPQHVPILILVNAKTDVIEVPGVVTPLAFDHDAYDNLDTEILSVFSRDRLITPDDVRGSAETLRDGVMAGNWPRLAEARGKVLFALDEPPEKVTQYMRGRPSLEGLPMFVNSVDAQAPHAAYFTMNDPVTDGSVIRELVEQGFLVRTRADADTKEARTNDVSRRQAAFDSGAQVISTDYYLPRTGWSDYQVILPGGHTARCNPVLAPLAC